MLNQIEDYKKDKKVITTVEKALKKIKKYSKEKINIKWANNLSNNKLDALVMDIYNLDYITKYTVDYEALKRATKELIIDEIIKIKKQEELDNDIWLNFLETIKLLDFKIIQKKKNEENGLIEFYIEHKNHFIIGYLLGGYQKGIKEARLFFNATEKIISKESVYKNIYHKGTNILVGSTSIKEDPKAAFNNIIKNFDIEDKWIDSDIRGYLPSSFFSYTNQLYLDENLMFKMSYYNLPKDSNEIPTFDREDSFKIKFNIAFNKLTKDDIDSLHLRARILNIKKDGKRFIKEKYIEHFEKNGILPEERLYLVSALLSRLDLVEDIENPFKNIKNTISKMDIDDCVELMEIIREKKKLKYSRYKLKESDLEYLKSRLRESPIDLYA